MLVLIRGGGDLASGVTYRLYQAGMRVVITELSEPLAIRRSVSFAEAVYAGNTTIEGIRAQLIKSGAGRVELFSLFKKGIVPVMVDPDFLSSSFLEPSVIVDARMLKQNVSYPINAKSLVIGLGPGFTAGENCHAVVETKRGHTLGRVYWHGSGSADTGIPDNILGQSGKRVLRSPAVGQFKAIAAICDQVKKDQPVAQVAGVIIKSPFDGILRGLLKDGLNVSLGMKVGDVDPRNDPGFCLLISDKALAIGGGVLEAILTRQDLRARMWDEDDR